jgi:hypothetical protein
VEILHDSLQKLAVAFALGVGHVKDACLEHLLVDVLTHGGLGILQHRASMVAALVGRGLHPWLDESEITFRITSEPEPLVGVSGTKGLDRDDKDGGHPVVDDVDVLEEARIRRGADATADSAESAE